MSKIAYLFVTAAAVAAIVLRLWQLGHIPQGLNIDEASYGYDAYSLVKTGYDMWSSRGISLTSFGDYKPAGLAYTLVPFVHALGLTTVATRLPSAIFGLLTLGITYLLISRLTKNKLLGIVATIFLSLSPWHFGISRQFYEANVGLFFMAITVLCQIAYLTSKKHSSLYVAAIAWAIAGYYYAVYRYLGVALFGITALVADNWRPRQNASLYVRVLIVGLVVALPYLKDMFGATGLIRMQQEGNMHTFGDTLTINENRQMCYLATGKNLTVSRLCYALWNKPAEKLVTTAKVYTQFLSPKYLFLDGYQKDMTPPTYGAYLEITLVFYLLGIVYVVKNYTKNSSLRYLAWSFLIAPLPAASAQALVIHRNLLGLYLTFVIMSLGALYALEIATQSLSRLGRLALITVLTLSLTWSQARYLANYFFVYTLQQPEIWHYDSPTLMSWLHTNAGDQRIYFYDYEFAPLYYAFYGPLDPTIYQHRAEWTAPNQYGWTHTYAIDPIVQSGDNVWKQLCAPEPVLMVLTPRKEWSSVALYTVRDFTDVHDLYAVYNSQTVANLLKTTNPTSFAAQCKAITE